MKELSIEQKAKRYDEAIERAKKWYNAPNVDKIPTFGNRVIEEIFPELKESGNIKIIKAIKYGLDHVFTNNTTVFEVTKEQCLAWLEKQGEHANFINKIQIGDKVTRNEDGALVNLSQLKRVAKKDEKQCEQKPATMSLDEAIEHCKEKSCGNSECALEHKQLEKWLTELKELKEQKPTWSEEDEDILNTIINHFKVDIECTDEDDMVRWLKFLKDRVQPKQEWSDEDEKKRTLLISILEVNHPNGYFKVNPANTLNMEAMHVEELVDWLKSLRPQSTWKPSEGHLKALEDAMNKYHGSYSATLCQLYGELEKLKK